MIRAAAVTVLALFAVVLAAPGAYAATCPKTSLLDLQDEVMCVICGVPLINAGGPQSDDERNFIRERADKCETKQQIKAALVAEYGDEVLAMPKKSGFDLTAYLVPIVVLVAALAAIVVGALKWRRGRDEDDTTSTGGPRSAAVDEDLQRYDL